MEQAIIPMESLAQLIRLQLENGGRSSLLVTGISMYPILRHRRDTVELVKPARIRRGIWFCTSETVGRKYCTGSSQGRRTARLSAAEIISGLQSRFAPDR